MKILILGATGRTGQYLLKEALQRGHYVSVLVRNAEKITVTSPQLTVFEGDATDRQTLKRAAQGCEAVVNVLNISRTSDFPWAKLRTPTDFLSKTMQNCIAVCQELGIRRVVITSAWGTQETRNEIPAWFRWLIEHSNIRHAYEDHERQEKLLQATDLQWTIVRPVGLTNATKQQRVQASFQNIPKPALTISRLAVAGFLLDAVEQQGCIRQMPTLSSR